MELQIIKDHLGCAAGATLLVSLGLGHESVATLGKVHFIPYAKPIEKSYLLGPQLSAIGTQSRRCCTQKLRTEKKQVS